MVCVKARRDRCGGECEEEEEDGGVVEKDAARRVVVVVVVVVGGLGGTTSGMAWGASMPRPKEDRDDEIQSLRSGRRRGVVQRLEEVVAKGEQGGGKSDPGSSPPRGRRPPCPGVCGVVVAARVGRRDTGVRVNEEEGTEDDSVAAGRVVLGLVVVVLKGVSMHDLLVGVDSEPSEELEEAEESDEQESSSSSFLLWLSLFFFFFFLVVVASPRSVGL